MISLIKTTIYLGDIISLIPLVYFRNLFGVLLTIFFFALTIILSDYLEEFVGVENSNIKTKLKRR